jgi:regulator of RNase E activity RraA
MTANLDEPVAAAPVLAEVIARLAECDTAAVSDALDSLGVPGVLAGIAARVPGVRACGTAFTVTYRPVSDDGPPFRNAANYLDDVPAGSVVVVDNGGSTCCTNWGSLLTAVALARGVRGTILHGSARDVGEIRAAGYPLFSTGVTMVSGKNRVELDAVGRVIDVHGIAVRPGDVVLADDNGALVVPAELAEEVLRRATRVDATERNIAAAVRNGQRLDQARKLFGYSTPWQDTPPTGTPDD